MSVSSAPRARMAVKASWPGVSRNVILRSSPSRSTVTWYAPMRCVMPPASRATTLVRRIVSSSRVLPWSTWPMTVTTGGRGFRSASSCSSSLSRSMSNCWSSSLSSSSAETILMFQPISSPRIWNVDSSSDWVAVAISPKWNSTVTSAAGFTLIFSARSASEAP